jgi:pimeloyl-ACP methyl ester carboxylesterase
LSQAHDLIQNNPGQTVNQLSDAEHYFFVDRGDGSRRLAYLEVGDRQAEHLLICIPGLLETRQSFQPLVDAVGHYAACRIICLDLCGRGDSDPLPAGQTYCMSVYLSDLRSFIAHQQGQAAKAQKPIKIHIIGTSMGGILAMYLASDPTLSIHTLTLNDIGLSLAWLSIYKLYEQVRKGMINDVDVIAKSLNVSARVIHDVRKQSHFDLPYKSDFYGMRFSHLLPDFKGRVQLICGADSSVCTAFEVDEFKTVVANQVLLSVANVAHPVALTPQVCSFVMEHLGIEKISSVTIGNRGIGNLIDMLMKQIIHSGSQMLHWIRRQLDFL